MVLAVADTRLIQVHIGTIARLNSELYTRAFILVSVLLLHI